MSKTNIFSNEEFSENIEKMSETKSYLIKILKGQELKSSQDVQKETQNQNLPENPIGFNPNDPVFKYLQKENKLYLLEKFKQELNKNKFEDKNNEDFQKIYTEQMLIIRGLNEENEIKKNKNLSLQIQLLESNLAKKQILQKSAEEKVDLLLNFEREKKSLREKLEEELGIFNIEIKDIQTKANNFEEANRKLVEKIGFYEGLHETNLNLEKSNQNLNEMIRLLKEKNEKYNKKLFSKIQSQVMQSLEEINSQVKQKLKESFVKYDRLKKYIIGIVKENEKKFSELNHELSESNIYRETIIFLNKQELKKINQEKADLISEHEELLSKLREKISNMECEHRKIEENNEQIVKKINDENEDLKKQSKRLKEQNMDLETQLLIQKKKNEELCKLDQINENDKEKPINEIKEPDGNNEEKEERQSIKILNDKQKQEEVSKEALINTDDQLLQVKKTEKDGIIIENIEIDKFNIVKNNNLELEKEIIKKECEENLEKEK